MSNKILGVLIAFFSVVILVLGVVIFSVVTEEPKKKASDDVEATDDIEYEKETPKQDEVEKDEPVVEEPEGQDEAQEDDSEEAEPVEVTEADKIQKAVEEIVESDLDNTTITRLRVNEDASTDEEKYIVLIDLQWDVKNSAKMTYKMLEMYGDHLAAKMADYDKINDFVEFWEVPYLKEGDVSLKRTYENTGNGMFLKDEMNMMQ